MNFIDLFSGASGMSEGFISAGFQPVAHVEVNTDACNTIKTRVAYHYLKQSGRISVYFDYLQGRVSKDILYKEIPNSLLNTVINREINDSTLNSIIQEITTNTGHNSYNDIDLIIGGPPCQAYSLLSRHEKDIETDPRNFLYIQYGKFLQKFKPKAFVFENVPGLLSANGGKHFSDIKMYFAKMGYVLHDRILDASDFGVVQSRRRVIIIGWKKKYDMGFPELYMQKSKWKVDDLFSGLPSFDPGEVVSNRSYQIKNNDYLEKFSYRDAEDILTQHIIRPVNANDREIYKYTITKWNNEHRRLNYNELPDSLKTRTNTKSFLDRYKVVDGNGLSHTLIAHISKDGHYYIHPDIKQCRSISVREAARIQSFPDSFYFEGSRAAVFTQIGNAVPPLLSTAIAQGMRGLLCQIS